MTKVGIGRTLGRRPSPLDLQLTTVAFVCNFEQESIPGGCVPPAFVIPGGRVSGGTLPPGYTTPWISFPPDTLPSRYSMPGYPAPSPDILAPPYPIPRRDIGPEIPYSPMEGIWEK